MIRILSPLTFAVMACVVVAGCAEDRHSDRQRSVYSHENIDMGPHQSGQQYRFDEPRQQQGPYGDPYGRPGGY